MNTAIRMRRNFAVVIVTAVSAVSFVGTANAQTTTTLGTGRPLPGQAGAGTRGGVGRSGPNREFCRQITDSQAVIAASKENAVAKLKLTATEWVKIEALAPAEIKPKVTIVRVGFQAAAKAKNSNPVKAKAVTAAGTAITTFVTANCNQGPGGAGGGGAAFTA